MTKRVGLLVLEGVVLIVATFSFGVADGAWLKKVPARDHEKTNPYRDQPDTVAAGRRVFLDHCAKCHGENAEGTKKRPPLRSPRVQQEASEGDIHWLLVNGNRGKGMPSWSKLGDPQIWQVIAYVKSLSRDPH